MTLCFLIIISYIIILCNSESFVSKLSQPQYIIVFSIAGSILFILCIAGCVLLYLRKQRIRAIQNRVLQSDLDTHHSIKIKPDGKKPDNYTSIEKDNILNKEPAMNFVDIINARNKKTNDNNIKLEQINNKLVYGPQNSPKMESTKLKNKKLLSQNDNEIDVEIEEMYEQHEGNINIDNNNDNNNNVNKNNQITKNGLQKNIIKVTTPIGNDNNVDVNNFEFNETPNDINNNINILPKTNEIQKKNDKLFDDKIINEETTKGLENDDKNDKNIITDDGNDNIDGENDHVSNVSAVMSNLTSIVSGNSNETESENEEDIVEDLYEESIEEDIFGH